MMGELVHDLILIGVAVVVTLISILVGAFVMFKGQRAVPGEPFIGKIPKGQVFNVVDKLEAEEFPEEEKNLLERTEKFLKTLGGKGI